MEEVAVCGRPGRADHPCGGCARISGIDEQIQAAIGMPVRVVNPFTRTALGPRVSPVRFTNDMQALLVAAGLSLRGLD